MDWKQGTPLGADQTGHPVLWHATLEAVGLDLVEMPAVDPTWFNMLWGDNKTTKRLTKWGHKDKRDKLSPHFLASRGGLGWHTDPGYGRYCLQVQLANPGGFVVHGIADDLARMPLFEPGLVILLDTWSPHTVRRDPRVRFYQGASKLLAGVDFNRRPDPLMELPQLVEHIPLLNLPGVQL